MPFGTGWFITFGTVFFLNGLFLLHLFAIDFKRARLAKSLALTLPALALNICFYVYFVCFFKGLTEEAFMRPLAYAAGFFMCLFLYSVAAFAGSDIYRLVRAAVRRMRGAERPARASWPRLFRPRGTLIVLGCCTAMSLLAYIAPQHIVVTERDIALDRGEGAAGGVRIAFVADTHIGSAVREGLMDEIVEKVNALDPDIVLLGGDIIDEGTPQSLRDYMADSFKGLRSRYGTYFILGNHDDYRGDTEDVLALMESAGITPLLDETVLIADSFYLIGREDKPSRREPFAMLAAEATRDLPIIVLDHRPASGETGEAGRSILQISGHTHDGQIFPFHIIDPLGKFTLQYGVYERKDLEIVVSSGAGEFGVPMRLGSPAEIVDVDVSFR
jgi:predicted MPP superfamily phosphohydrolase